MNKLHRAPLLGATILTLASLLAACGGGGGGGSTTPPVSGGGGGGGGSATPTPPVATSTPIATPTPGTSGTLTIGSTALANATVVFTCGCNGDGGKITTDANGAYNIGFSAPSVTTSGTYSPSGHNLMVVGYANGTQAWTMQFLGNTAANNHNLGSTSSDLASTAAALYVYYAAGTQISSSDKTFDWFNFNTIIAFANHLRTSPTSNEQKLMNDITAAQTAGQTLYPKYAPTWDPFGSKTINTTITSDVQAVATDGMSKDSTLPTPCPAAGQCTGAPTP